MAGANKAEIIKFIKEEISETETALAFVEAEIAAGNKTQFNAVYVRKRAEYGGVLWALHAVLDIAEGREEESE